MTTSKEDKMTYLCPICTQNDLSVVGKIAASHGRKADRIIHFLLCNHCGLQALAFFGESGEETAEQVGYIVDRSTWADLHLSWAGCPDPLEKSCQCPAHLKLGRFDPVGERSFPCRLR